MIPLAPSFAPRSRSRGEFRLSATLLLLLSAAPSAGFSQEPAGHPEPSHAATPSETPQAWIASAVANEVRLIQDDGTFPLRYRVRKIDNKGDTTREVIETQQGSVARMIERNGQPLTSAQDSAEKDRLNEILASPSDFLRHHKRDNANRDDTLQIVRLMPEAMLYTFAPGQPQPEGAPSPQIVIDFHPNPSFHPPTIASDLLTGLEGRLWIDARTRHMTRAEARVLRPVSFGWGIIGKIYPGGTVAFEQAKIAGDRWVYSHVDTHLTMRVIFKTIAMNDTMSAANFDLLPAPLSVQEAIHQLLAMQIPLR